MIDKMKPIKGFFKVERLNPNGEVIDSFEKKNMVMARVPEVIAGQVSGLYQKYVQDHLIASIAIGTGGLRKNALGGLDPTPVQNDRVSLFSERNFWKTKQDAAAGRPTIPMMDKFVYQSTFEASPFGDMGGNTAASSELSIQNFGPTYPIWESSDPLLPNNSFIGFPKSYRGNKPGALNNEKFTGTVSQRQNMIEYNFTLGQFAGNWPNVLVGYNEAALYMRLDSNNSPGKPENGNPLGTLFSMVTFPNQWKDNTCAIRINWKIYF